MKRKLIVVFPIFIITLTSAYGQANAVLNNIVAKLQSLSTTKTIEKAYLHFDKPYYAAGDTIFFKAYVTVGERHQLTNLSGILYADLIDQKNEILQTIKLQIIEGIGWGDFALPDTLRKGTYRVRAYTKYMQAGDQGDFFDKSINIGSIYDNPVTQSNGASAEGVNTDVQFFPEGGVFMSGLPNKIAFKALSPNGTGADIKGIILDNTGRKLGSFSSLRMGMGSFVLKPEPGITYKAKITYADGSQKTLPLPLPAIKGIALAIKDTLDKLSIEIRCNKAYYQENAKKDYYLVIYAGGILTKVVANLDNPVLGLDILKNQFPSGVVQVTLFSAEGEPLCERLVFNRSNDLLNVEVNSNKSTYHPREKVQLNLGVKNKNGVSSAGHFSVSVIDESKVTSNDDDEQNILTYLLLTSSVKGFIEQPNYYFAHRTKEAMENLDALMLTQGYRRFAWKTLLQDTTAAKKFTPENSFTISGLVRYPAGKMAVAEELVLRDVKSGSVLTTKTDDKGIFKFANLVYFGNAEFTLQAASVKGKKVIPKITLDPTVPAPPVSITTNPGTNKADANSMMLAYLNNEKLRLPASQVAVKGQVLKQVNVVNKNVYRTSSLAGAGNADQVIKGEELENFPLLSEGLSGRLRGVDFNAGVPYLKTAQVITGGGMVAEPALVAVDGVMRPAGSGLDDISPMTVENVELLKSANASIYGLQGGAGVIVITTRLSRNFTEAVQQPNGSIKFSQQGFYKSREFYEPKYSAPVNGNPIRDLRSTIYWKPELLTDKEGTASVAYFNADGTGTYRVVVEGIDINGNIGRQVYRYKVE
jgi:hypothetical protein